MPQFFIIFTIFAASAGGFIAFHKASINRALEEAHKESVFEGEKINNAIVYSRKCAAKIRSFHDLIKCLEDVK